MSPLIFWLPFVFGTLHVVEEFGWPGGFIDWYRKYRPAIAASMTPGFMVVVNALFLVTGFTLGWLGSAWTGGLSTWLILAALVGANAVFHIIGMLRTRRYSPGVVTGTVLYLPLCVLGYWYFISHGEVSARFATKCFLIGSSYEIWSLTIHHVRSSKTARPDS